MKRTPLTRLLAPHMVSAPLRALSLVLTVAGCGEYDAEDDPEATIEAAYLHLPTSGTGRTGPYLFFGHQGQPVQTPIRVGMMC